MVTTMNKELIYSKLTPSAKEAINELTESYKDTLLEKAFTIANERDTASKEISLRDILEAQQTEKFVNDKSKQNDYKRRRWTMLIALSGATYAAAGIIIYLLQNKKFSLDTDLGLIIAIIGILLSLIAFIYGQLISKRQLYVSELKLEMNNPSIDTFDIVKRWQIIEQLTMSIMKSNNKTDTKFNSVNQVIKFLTDNFAKSDEDYLKIRQLLQARNKILHDGYVLTDYERDQYTQIADDIIDKLEKAKK